jgi:hypothetical protein
MRKVTTRLIGFYGVYDQQYQFTRELFDYIDTPVDYATATNLPTTFGGVSGGGLWASRVTTQDAGKSFSCAPPIFCGVAFYQTDLQSHQRSIRHHFVHSIYEIAKAKLLNNSTMSPIP